MNDSLKKTINSSLILIFVLGIVLSLGFSGYVLKQFQSEEKAYSNTAFYERVKSECDTSFKRMGVRVAARGDIFELSKDGLDDFQELFSKVSLGIKDCPGFKIEKACVGTECGSDFEMTLRFVKQ